MTTIGKETKLKVVYGNQKSFGGKAITRTDINQYGIYHSLFSYETFIIELKEFDNKEIIINAMSEDEKHLTNTTIRHLNEFMLQHGLESKTNTEWIETQANQFNYSY